MNSSSAKIKNVVVSHEALTVELVDGRVISAPLTWYPTLVQATAKQLRNWKRRGAGTGHPLACLGLPSQYGRFAARGTGSRRRHPPSPRPRRKLTAEG